MTTDLAALRNLPPATCYRTHTQPDEHRAVFGAVWLADVKRVLSRPPAPEPCPDKPPKPETRHLYCPGCLSYFDGLATPEPRPSLDVETAVAQALVEAGSNDGRSSNGVLRRAPGKGLHRRPPLSRGAPVNAPPEVMVAIFAIWFVVAFVRRERGRRR